MQASDQGFSMPIKATQGTQTATFKETQKHPPSFPMGVILPNELQGEIPIVFIRERFQDEVFFVPHGISVPKRKQEDFILIPSYNVKSSE